MMVLNVSIENAGLVVLYIAVYQKAIEIDPNFNRIQNLSLALVQNLKLKYKVD